VRLREGADLIAIALLHLEKVACGLRGPPQIGQRFSDISSVAAPYAGRAKKRGFCRLLSAAYFAAGAASTFFLPALALSAFFGGSTGFNRLSRDVKITSYLYEGIS
jgi:hypothetical protein